MKFKGTVIVANKTIVIHFLHILLIIALKLRWVNTLFYINSSLKELQNELILQ